MVEPEELADSLKRLATWAERHAPEPESAVRQRLREHFGGDPGELPIVSRPLSGWDRPNFQVAIDAWGAGREVEVVGLPVIQGYRAGLAELVSASYCGVRRCWPPRNPTARSSSPRTRSSAPWRSCATAPRTSRTRCSARDRRRRKSRRGTSADVQA